MNTKNIWKRFKLKQLRIYIYIRYSKIKYFKIFYFLLHRNNSFKKNIPVYIAFMYIKQSAKFSIVIFFFNSIFNPTLLSQKIFFRIKYKKITI